VAEFIGLIVRPGARRGERRYNAATFIRAIRGIRGF
jgi:hypothetical protein